MNLPHVPLEAGASPENPPCPACGEPLFPWVGMPVASGIAHRCEACGLGVLSHGEKFDFPPRPGEEGGAVGGTVSRTSGAGEAEVPVGDAPGRTSPGVPRTPPTGTSANDIVGNSFDPGTAEDALAELESDRDGDNSYLFDNRASFACWLTGGAWVGLGTDRRYRFTPHAVTDLIATQDQVVTKTKWRPLRGIAVMWQSGLNMFTFGQNIVMGAFGKAHKVEGNRPWKRGLDWFISIVLAIPALIVAVPFELIAILFRRGASGKAEIQVL